MILNHVGESITNSVSYAAVGYGLTRACTTLNPVAGGVFFGCFKLAQVVTKPVFEGKKSSLPKRLVGTVAQVAMAWLATSHVTSVLAPVLTAIKAEVLTTIPYVAASISLPAVGVLAAVSIICLVAFKGFGMNSDKRSVSY